MEDVASITCPISGEVCHSFLVIHSVAVELCVDRDAGE